MNRTYATELVRRIAPELKSECAVQPILPLEIKLHLERIKLMELIRERDEKGLPSKSIAHAEMYAAC